MKLGKVYVARPQIGEEAKTISAPLGARSALSVREIGIPVACKHESNGEESGFPARVK